MGEYAEEDAYREYKKDQENLSAHQLKKKQTLEAMIGDIDNMITYYERKIDQYRNEIEKYRAQRNILDELLAA